MRFKIILFFFLLILSVLTVNAGILQPPDGCEDEDSVNMDFCWATSEGFAGYVIDEKTGYGIYDVSIKVYQGSTPWISTGTGTGGHFYISNALGSGDCRYTFVFSKSGYESVTIDCGDYCNFPKDCVSPYQPPSFGNVYLKPKAPETDGTLEICVSDCTDGSALPGAVVYIGSKSVTLDSSGCGSVELGQGSYSIWVLEEDYEIYYEGDISIEVGETVFRDVELAPIVDCGLRVQDVSGTFTPACVPECSYKQRPLKVYNGSGIYKVALVDPSDSTASNVSINTDNGIKALVDAGKITSYIS